MYDERFVLKLLSQKTSELPNGNRTRVSRLPVRLFCHYTIGSQTASMTLIRDLVRNIDMPLSYLYIYIYIYVIITPSFSNFKIIYLSMWHGHREDIGVCLFSSLTHY